MVIINRVRQRITENECSQAVLISLIDTMTDRLCLRLGEEELPERFETICADAVVKMFRRFYYEGISSENLSSISDSFYEDILNEYSAEINNYNKVCFL